MCDDTNGLLDLQYFYHSGDSSSEAEYFSKHKFLSSLRNIRFVVMGDSLGLQLYYSLLALCHNEVSSFKYTLARPKNKYHINRGVATAKSYNATLEYVLARTTEDAKEFVMSNDFLHVKAILISIGAWYKPGFLDRRARYNLTRDSEFYQDAMRELRSEISQRQLLSANSTKDITPLKVIWQLCSHMGPSDDKRFQNLSTIDKGLFWDTFPYEAEWVPSYNRVLRKIASQYCDSVLDVYTISREFILHANALRSIYSSKVPSKYNSTDIFPQPFHTVDSKTGDRTLYANIEDYYKSVITVISPNSTSYAAIRVHSDSLHYCQGGVHRAAALLLQEQM